MQVTVLLSPFPPPWAGPTVQGEVEMVKIEQVCDLDREIPMEGIDTEVEVLKLPKLP